MSENRLKYLEMIQAIINRMAGNSFLLKEWSVILVSALFALAAKDTNICFVYLAYFPVIAFWILDGFYLRQERLFRKLYDYARKIEEDKVDFSMDTSPFKIDVATWVRVVWSVTLRTFYISIAATIFIVLLISAYLCK